MKTYYLADTALNHWRISHSDDTGAMIDCPALGRPIATVWSGGKEYSRLVAAAPELAALLNEAREMLCLVEGEASIQLESRIDALLKKAGF